MIAKGGAAWPFVLFRFLAFAVAFLAYQAAPKAGPDAKKPNLATTLPLLDPALLGVPLNPTWPKQLFVVADSVLLGAKGSLIRSLPDWRVTFVGRPALMISKAVEVIQRRPEAIGPVAVVALGYNSLWERDRRNYEIWSTRFDNSVEEMLTILKQKGAKKIVWVMLRELTPDLLPKASVSLLQYREYAWYFPYVNERLLAIKERHPEMALADWKSVARQPDITYDAIHVNMHGAEVMTALLRLTIGIDVMSDVRHALHNNLPYASENCGCETSAEQVATDNQRAWTLSPQYNSTFRDCMACPEMIVLPSGTFMMGESESESGYIQSRGPNRLVTIRRPFAIGKFEVTFA
jgi:hypothetical protein